MKTFVISASILLLISFSRLMAAIGTEIRDGEVAVQLVSPYQTIQPGQTVPIGMRFAMDDGWHIYWKNPGDTGRAPEIRWELPEGTAVGELRWPYPAIYRNAHLVDFIYSEEVTLYTEITVPKDWPVGKSFKVRARVDWLMCAEICIPGDAEVSLNLPVGNSMQTDLAQEEPFSATARNWPVSLDQMSAEVSSDEDRLQIIIPNLLAPDGDMNSLFYFPINSIVAPSGEQQWRVGEGGLIGELVRSEYAQEIPERITGILYHPDGWPSANGRKALTIEAVYTAAAPVAAIGTLTDSRKAGLAALLGLAFVGGTILNLMPCVFPVLGLKIMGFVEQAGNDKGRIIRHGLIFGLGVIVSFWVLAGALLALRAGGAELGWGFQLQSAPFVFGMTAFLLLFALNLSGVFEIGMGLMTLGSKADTGKGEGGSFLSGVLATVVATPCSAPFLATALAGALTLPPFQSFLTFTFIGLGLSAPYLLLSLFPGLLKKLPRPGPWMETLKEFMAFPLYATVGWLVYVLAGQLSGENLLGVLLSLTLLALAAWVYGRYSAPHRSKSMRRTGVLISILLFASAIAYGYPKKESVTWITWSPETIANLREENRTIYVDFTARWCATCQVNKAVVFSSDEVLETIAELDVALVKADWTNENPAITRRLEELGKAAVPVTLVYQPEQEDPTLLPETLSPGIVVRALRDGQRGR